MTDPWGFWLLIATACLYRAGAKARLKPGTAQRVDSYEATVDALQHLGEAVTWSPA